MKKRDRHRLIRRLVSENEIQKQEDIVEILHNQSIDVTQATVSRDIKELKLVKVPAENGGYRYSLPVDTSAQDTKKRMMRLFKDAFLRSDRMEKFVVIHTVPGNASALAGLLEKVFSQLIFAVLSTDDNILIIARSDDQAIQLERKLKEIE